MPSRFEEGRLPPGLSAAVYRMALKLRRAEEKGVIQYPTRAGSFKRLLRGAAAALRGTALDLQPALSSAMVGQLTAALHDPHLVRMIMESQDRDRTVPD